MSLAHQIRPAVPAIANSTSARLPASYEAAKLALAQCEAVDECKDWADKAAALASYARQAEDLELERKAARIRARAMRRAGELLKQIEPGHGARDGKREERALLPLRSEVARDAGMSEHQQKQAIRIASIPEPEFERAVESSAPPTITTLAQQGVQKRQAPDPETWLKGRDPEVFNKAMHFVGAFESYQRDIEKVDVDKVLPGLIDSERDRIRKAIAAIDAFHDTVATRI